MGWLNLTRKRLEQIVVTVPPSSGPTRIVVSIAEIERSQVMLGIDAPRCVAVNRREVQDEIDRQEWLTWRAKQGGDGRTETGGLTTHADHVQRRLGRS